MPKFLHPFARATGPDQANDAEIVMIKEVPKPKGKGKSKKG